MTASEISARLQELGDAEHARVLQKFFKTGKGQYGEGDIFVGLRVPQLRRLAKEYRRLALPETILLLRSPIHEARLLALLILVHAYTKGDTAVQEEIYSLYMEHTCFINSWDLVDASAEHIVGRYLRFRSRFPLHALAESRILWQRRIAVMATFHFIRCGEFDETLVIAEKLLKDREDLIHKAVGWMLREVGKRDLSTEVDFLNIHYKTMPRTMLRYAVERFPEELRQQYICGTIPKPR